MPGTSPPGSPPDSARRRSASPKGRSVSVSGASVASTVAPSALATEPKTVTVVVVGTADVADLSCFSDVLLLAAESPHLQRPMMAWLRAEGIVSTSASAGCGAPTTYTPREFERVARLMATKAATAAGNAIVTTRTSELRLLIEPTLQGIADTARELAGIVEAPSLRRGDDAASNTTITPMMAYDAHWHFTGDYIANDDGGVLLVSGDASLPLDEVNALVGSPVCECVRAAPGSRDALEQERTPNVATPLLPHAPFPSFARRCDGAKLQRLPIPELVERVRAQHAARSRAAGEAAVLMDRADSLTMIHMANLALREDAWEPYARFRNLAAAAGTATLSPHTRVSPSQSPLRGSLRTAKPVPFTSAADARATALARMKALGAGVLQPSVWREAKELPRVLRIPVQPEACLDAALLKTYMVQQWSEAVEQRVLDQFVGLAAAGARCGTRNMLADAGPLPSWAVAHAAQLLQEPHGTSDAGSAAAIRPFRVVFFRACNDAVVLETPDAMVLVDGGSAAGFEATVWPYLRARGLHRLKVCIATHSSRDHSGGLVKLYEWIADTNARAAAAAAAAKAATRRGSSASPKRDASPPAATVERVEPPMLIAQTYEALAGIPAGVVAEGRYLRALGASLGCLATPRDAETFTVHNVTFQALSTPAQRAARSRIAGTTAASSPRGATASLDVVRRCSLAYRVKCGVTNTVVLLTGDAHLCDVVGSLSTTITSFELVQVPHHGLMPSAAVPSDPSLLPKARIGYVCTGTEAGVAPEKLLSATSDDAKRPTTPPSPPRDRVLTMYPAAKLFTTDVPTSSSARNAGSVLISPERGCSQRDGVGLSWTFGGIGACEYTPLPARGDPLAVVASSPTRAMRPKTGERRSPK